MSESLMTLLIAVVSGGIGVFTARLFSKNSNQKTEAEAQERAAEILKNAELEAENIKKNRILEAKEKYLQLKSEFDETSNQKKQIIIQNEQKIKQREQQINQMMEQNKRRESELETQKNTLSQQTEIANKTPAAMSRAPIARLMLPLSGSHAPRHTAPRQARRPAPGFRSFGVT